MNDTSTVTQLPRADDVIRRYRDIEAFLEARTNKLQNEGMNSEEQRVIDALEEMAAECQPTEAGMVSQKADTLARAAQLLRFWLTPDKHYQDGMDAFKRAAALIMHHTGQSNLKTEFGTAYYSTVLSVKCDDREAWMDFVFRSNGRQYLTAHTNKEAVKEYMDANGGHMPPGLSGEPVRKLIIRK